MAQYHVPYDDSQFERVDKWSTELTQRVQCDLGNERLLIVDLARSMTIPDPIVVNAAIYRVYTRTNGQKQIRMSQTVRRAEVQIDAQPLAH